MCILQCPPSLIKMNGMQTEGCVCSLGNKLKERKSDTRPHSVTAERPEADTNVLPLCLCAGEADLDAPGANGPPSHPLTRPADVTAPGMMEHSHSKLRER